MKKLYQYFTWFELILWGSCVAAIIVSFLLFDCENILALVASLVGITSLIFNAKGNPLGQALMIVFSIIYGIISFSYAYYGEMLTYLCMTAPMAVIALVSWLKNPYQGNRCEVKANKLKTREYVFMFAITAVVTLIFYWILFAFETANLLPSTASVATSFIAVYLTFRRSPFFALAYAANDAVLIALWILAMLEDRSYLSVVVCFGAFLLSDIYGFYSWKKMLRRQSSENSVQAEQNLRTE